MLSKKALRHNLRSQRDKLSEELRIKKSLNICHQIEQLESFQKARHILIYYPFESEVDLRPLFNLHPQKNWYLPKIIEGEHFIALPFKDETELIKNQHSFLEPAVDLSEKADHLIELILVPGLGFDLWGNRLGMGKGYYDRYLRNARKILKIGVAFKEQIIDTVPTDAHDVSMNLVIFDQI